MNSVLGECTCGIWGRQGRGITEATVALKAGPGRKAAMSVWVLGFPKGSYKRIRKRWPTAGHGELATFFGNFIFLNALSLARYGAGDRGLKGSFLLLHTIVY